MTVDKLIVRYKYLMLDDIRKGIQILSVEKDGDDGLIVAFSDGTTGAYVVEELLGLRPCRQLGEKPKGQNLPQTPKTH